MFDLTDRVLLAVSSQRAKPQTYQQLASRPEQNQTRALRYVGAAHRPYTSSLRILRHDSPRAEWRYY